VEGELAELGFRVVAISPDQPSRLVESLEVKDLGYALYSDARMDAARAMGIAYRLGDADIARYRGFGIDLEEASGEVHHELPVPSVFLVAKGGRILWVYSNPDYKVRPDNDRLLEAAREAAAPAP
jgi:peroxiredoxin